MPNVMLVLLAAVAMLPALATASCVHPPCSAEEAFETAAELQAHSRAMADFDEAIVGRELIDSADLDDDMHASLDAPSIARELIASAELHELHPAYGLPSAPRQRTPFPVTPNFIVPAPTPAPRRTLRAPIVQPVATPVLKYVPLAPVVPAARKQRVRVGAAAATGAATGSATGSATGAATGATGSFVPAARKGPASAALQPMAAPKKPLVRVGAAAPVAVPVVARKKTVTWIGDSHTGGIMGQTLRAVLSPRYDLRMYGCGGSSPTWWFDDTKGFPVSAPGTYVTVPALPIKQCGRFPCCPKFSQVLPTGSMFDLIVIEMCGTNLLGASLDDFTRQVTKTLSVIAGKNRKCLFVGPPPAGVSKVDVSRRATATPANIAAKSDLLRRLVAGKCDYQDSAKTLQGTPLVYDGPDGWHYGKNGKAWAAVLAYKINHMLE